MSRTSVVLALSRLGGLGCGSSLVALPFRKCTCACGSAWVTSRRMPLWRYSCDDALVRDPGRTTMSMQRCLSSVNGAPLSTSCGTRRPRSALDSACFSGSCMVTCAPSRGQVLACIVVMVPPSLLRWHLGQPGTKNSSQGSPRT